MKTFYEFFCGGGMARMGLGRDWECLFANDFDHKKGRIYKEHWGDDVLKIADVRKLTTHHLPGHANLVWASFPCQDLSLAGGGAGLKGDRSGTFWPFWALIKALKNKATSPNIVVLENVCGTLNSHGGNDFNAICSALADTGYGFGAVVIDAALFVPQSRPRLFIVALREGLECPGNLLSDGPDALWHTKPLRNAYSQLAELTKQKWIWWSVPKPKIRNTHFIDLIEDDPTSVAWHSGAETARLLSMMSDVNFAKVSRAKETGRRMVGAIYKRTRLDPDGFKVQRAEIRFDDLAGCLRTPAGGSSRQLIMVVHKDSVRSRLISSRETARLMGLPDEYQLPDNYNEAYHLTGDGVVVPVVRHLAENLFEPILSHAAIVESEAA